MIWLWVCGDEKINKYDVKDYGLVVKQIKVLRGLLNFFAKDNLQHKEVKERIVKLENKLKERCDNVNHPLYSKREQIIEEIELLNAQNLNGRETEEEIYRQGIADAFDHLISDHD